MGNEANILHIVDTSVRGRAEKARLALGIGRHAEIYDSVDEFCRKPPHSGVLIVGDQAEGGPLEEIAGCLARLGIWLPMVAIADNPRPRRVVEALDAGVIDYMALPLREQRFREALGKAEREIAVRGARRRRMIQARCRIASLTRREREVLHLVTEGASNKVIGRELGISPRTVEIHRANMMAKLDARHACDAVRMRIDALMDDPYAPGAPPVPEFAEAAGAFRAPRGEPDAPAREPLRARGG